MRGLLTNAMRFDFSRNPAGDIIVGNGPPHKTEHVTGKRVQFSGTFAGGWSVQLQGTVDGTNYVNIGSAITAAGIVEVPEFWRFLRVNVGVVGTADLMHANLGGYTVGDHE